MTCHWVQKGERLLEELMVLCSGASRSCKGLLRLVKQSVGEVSSTNALDSELDHKVIKQALIKGGFYDE